MNLYFTSEIRDCLDLFGTPMAPKTYYSSICNDGVQFQMKIRNISRSSSRGHRRTWSFHIVVLQRTAQKCTMINDARAQLLFCSLNLLFGDVLVAVVVVVCLKGHCHDKAHVRSWLPPFFWLANRNLNTITSATNSPGVSRAFRKYSSAGFWVLFAKNIYYV